MTFQIQELILVSAIMLTGVVIGSFPESGQGDGVALLADYQMFNAVCYGITIVHTPVFIDDWERDILIAVVLLAILIGGLTNQHTFQVVEVGAQSDDLLLTLQFNLKALMGRFIRGHVSLVDEIINLPVFRFYGFVLLWNGGLAVEGIGNCKFQMKLRYAAPVLFHHSTTADKRTFLHVSLYELH